MLAVTDLDRSVRRVHVEDVGIEAGIPERLELTPRLSTQLARHDPALPSQPSRERSESGREEEADGEVDGQLSCVLPGSDSLKSVQPGESTIEMMNLASEDQFVGGGLEHMVEEERPAVDPHGCGASVSYGKHTWHRSIVFSRSE
ncbi:MAG TPA: hypothetical protein VMM14_00090 [Acidimicrobiia bacterium]|nr:hypothetical protein [Acidimicrobiia bacterium]